VNIHAEESFLELLGEELGPENCKHDGCDRKRIQYSVMCRRHHFEMIKQRPMPEGQLNE
jgi:hypothetical protein